MYLWDMESWSPGSLQCPSMWTLYLSQTILPSITHRNSWQQLSEISDMSLSYLVSVYYLESLLGRGCKGLDTEPGTLNIESLPSDYGFSSTTIF